MDNENCLDFEEEKKMEEMREKKRKKEGKRKEENGMETRIVWKESEKPFLFPYFLSDQHTRSISLSFFPFISSFYFLS